jgi:NADH-quinone oxidoreductase subunit N
VLSPAGVEAILFYLVTYLFMNLGAFYVVLLVANRSGSEEVSAFRGMGSRSAFLAVGMALFLFSLTGLPPFAGFIGKVYLFKALVQKGVYWLAIVAALNSAVSLYYYARIVKAMFLEKAEDTSEFPVSPLASALIFIFMVPTMVLGVYWEPVIRMAAEASTKLTSF